MTDTRQMLDASPVAVQLGADEVAAAIDACLTCLQACISCANSDLAEPDVEEMRTCVAIDQNCADVCDVTARVLSRPAYSDDFVVHRLLQACVRLCTTCAEECTSTHTITVTARSARRRASRACTRVTSCSRLRPSNS